MKATGKNMNILFFSCGDSNTLSTWSNVPYLFARTLEEKGHHLIRVNIYPNKILMHLFNSISFRLYRKLLRKRACPIFERTVLHRWIIDCRIKLATRLHPDSDINLFLSFGFINKYSTKPSILWCDWSDAIVIQRQNRSPEWYERKSLAAESENIRKADAVFSMFSVCARQMSNMYEREIIHLNRNVVNTVYGRQWNLDDVIAKRMGSKELLFIGNYLYIDGAVKLIKAFTYLRRKYPELRLHIIGMTQNQLPETEGMICYGYLHKDIKNERDAYYRLLLSCRCIINPTPGWAGYSSTIEAMFYGCPLIVYPYDEFIEEFGETIEFGRYCNSENLPECINDMLLTTNYKEMCLKAHKLVEHYSWSEYIDEFLERLSSIIRTKCR